MHTKSWMKRLLRIDKIAIEDVNFETINDEELLVIKARPMSRDTNRCSNCGKHYADMIRLIRRDDGGHWISKTQKYALLKNPENLTKNQQAAMEMLIKSDKRLYRTYLRKESLQAESLSLSNLARR